MEETIKLIRSELALSEDALFASLASDASTQSFGSAPGETEDNPALGRMIFKRRVPDFRDKLCSNPIVVKYFLEKRTDDNDDILIELVDVIVACSINLPVTKLVAIILRVGLKEICNHDKSGGSA
jgi:hypothetical protein